MTEEKDTPPQPASAAEAKSLQKEEVVSRRKREDPPYVNEKLDRPPRFRNVRDVMNHIKLKRMESAYTRKEELIHEILNGQSEKDRVAILTDLIERLTNRQSKKERDRAAEENQLNPNWLNGAYPYVNRLRRSVYEEEKLALRKLPGK